MFVWDDFLSQYTVGSKFEASVPTSHKKINSDSFIFYTTYSIVGHSGAGAYLQQSTSERQGTPWAGRQSITGQHRDKQDKPQKAFLMNMSKPSFGMDRSY
ncbi:hypothetical protein CHARACLAT_022764 [Characodon lateralis]|uniref:Uncharacterized protein n=1 Tax=Characodon lateralis TaxID=208331 RepID=A0ABU7D429_9TELE|nr:hypothetical protein [Characodon lateralis]